MIEIRHERMNTTDETRAAYNDLYEDGGIDLSDSYYLWVLRALNPRPGSMLLDISCGRGRLVELACQQGVRAIGLDFSARAVAAGARRAPAAGWLISNGECAGLKNGCADYVTHIGNLEHYQDPAAGVREAARLLKPGGLACILLPNTFSFFGNIQHVTQTGFVFDDGQPLQRYHTRGGWAQLLEANGFKVVRTIRYEHAAPRTRKDWQAHLRRPTRLMRLLVQWMVPFNLSNCFVYFCQHADA